MLFIRESILKIEELSGIYRIMVYNYDMSYIGVSVNVRKRLLDHFNNLKNRKHPNNILQDVYIISKWGFIPHLEFEILEVVEQNGHSISDLYRILNKKETDWILKKYKKDILMNQCGFVRKLEKELSD